MAITYNGTNIDKIVYNGTEIFGGGKLTTLYSGDINRNGTYTIGSLSGAELIFIQSSDNTGSARHIQCMSLLPLANNTFVSSTAETYIVNNGIRIHFPSNTQITVDNINNGHILKIVRVGGVSRKRRSQLKHFRKRGALCQ